MIAITGKMSTFGGVNDLGVAPDEGLALIERLDLAESAWFRRLFLSPLDRRFGLARNLDPREFYVAMRWDYGVTPKSLLKRSLVKLSVPNRSDITPIFAQPVDFGPGNGSVIDGVRCPETGRIADLSPACAQALGLETDDEVTCQLILATDSWGTRASNGVTAAHDGNLAANADAGAFNHVTTEEDS